MVTSQRRAAGLAMALLACLPWTWRVLAAQGPPRKAPPVPGVYFEQTTQVFVDGEPAGPAVNSRAWQEGRRLRLESGEGEGGTALVLRFDTRRAFRLDPVERTAQVLDVERLRARSRADIAVAAELLGPLGVVPPPVALAGERTIAGRACRGHRLTTGGLVMDVWVARDVPLGAEAFAEMLEWSGAAARLGPLMSGLRKLPGFPVETHASVEVLGQRVETLATVSRLVLGRAPAGLFDVPAGYRVVEAER
jgi:hypothetical protein